MRFKQAAIIGVGLIGGSLGLAIKQKRLAQKVIGIGHRRQSIEEAVKKGVVDQGYLDIRKVAGSDLVILAAPVNEIITIIPKLSKVVSPDCLVIDVGSTKSEILKAAQKVRLTFVGCHPLAGMEKKGSEYASGSMFENALCLVVPPKKINPEIIAAVKSFWQAVGARIKVVDAASHDRILAFVSHLPHMVVFSLIDALAPEYLPYAASGLKDTTRIGLSDPAVWKDIFLTNRLPLLKAIKVFKNSLTRLESFIKTNQPKKIMAYLEKSRSKRNAITS